MQSGSFNQKIKEKSIVILIHEHVTGGIGHVLRDFLLEKNVKNLLFISHPLLYVKEMYEKSSYFEFYKKTKLKEKHKALHWKLPEPLLYLKDLIYTVYWSYNTGIKYDCIIALDPLNSISGILLKILRRADRVIYYSIDYFPTRFENPLMNRIYHFVDKLAVRFSDETWNVGKRMSKARAQSNNMKGSEYRKKQFHVPIGVWFTKIKKHPISKFDSKKLIFAGHFVPYMGIDLVIRTLPKIIEHIPNLKLDIIGRGEERVNWEKLSKKLGVEKHITYMDWIQDRQKFHSRLGNAAIGLAPFNLNILDDKVKNADPGKIKDYTSVGLPVITTKAIYTWRDIEKAKCGFIINYKEDEFAKAVIKLLQDRDLLMQYKKNALEYSKEFDWEKIFTKNLTRVMSK